MTLRKDFLHIFLQILFLSGDNKVILEIFKVLYQYLKTEPCNRIILFACDEAISLMDRAGFSQLEELSLEQKKDLIDKLNFRIVEEGEIKEIADFKKNPQEINGWYLVPKSRYAESIDSSTQKKPPHKQNTIRKIFFGIAEYRRQVGSWFNKQKSRLNRVDRKKLKKQ